MAALLCSVSSRETSAQESPAHLRVVVSVEEPVTKGAIASAFRAALRGLGDVDVVTASEDPDFVLEAVFMCENEASDCRSNVGAIHVYSPLRESAVRDVTYLSGAKEPDSVVKKMASYFASYEYPRKLLTVVWGSQRYDDAARRFIGQLDSQCFERVRRYRRAATMPPAERQAAWTAIDKAPNEC